MGGKGKRDKQKEIEARKQDRKNQKVLSKNMRKKMTRSENFKLSREYNQYFAEFNQEISILKLRLQDVGGDGNCLFRSIADQVDGNQTTHIFMRDEACKHILNNEPFFKNFIDEDEEGTVEQYTNIMKRNGEWGGHLELQALSECFKCVIVVHKKNLQEYYVTPLNTEPLGGIIHVAYFQHQDFEHYLSIREISDFSQDPATSKLKDLNDNMYKHLLFEDPEDYLLMKQIEELQLADQNGHEKKEQQILEPYPNYPRNKKCKCGSKDSYKNCCFKEYQKKISKMGY